MSQGRHDPLPTLHSSPPLLCSPFVFPPHDDVITIITFKFTLQASAGGGVPSQCEREWEGGKESEFSLMRTILRIVRWRCRVSKRYYRSDAIVNPKKKRAYYYILSYSERTNWSGALTNDRLRSFWSVSKRIHSMSDRRSLKIVPLSPFLLLDLSFCISFLINIKIFRLFFLCACVCVYIYI